MWKAPTCVDATGGNISWAWNSGNPPFFQIGFGGGVGQPATAFSGPLLSNVLVFATGAGQFTVRGCQSDGTPLTAANNLIAVT